MQVPQWLEKSSHFEADGTQLSIRLILQACFPKGAFSFSTSYLNSLICTDKEK